MSRATRSDELAEQVAVLYGWAPIHADTEREKALNQLWHEWADERGGYLKEHIELTDARIAELARQYDERHDTTAAQVSELVADGPPPYCTGRHNWYIHEHNTPCYGWNSEVFRAPFEVLLPPGTVHCRTCFKVKGSRKAVPRVTRPAPLPWDMSGPDYDDEPGGVWTATGNSALTPERVAGVRPLLEQAMRVGRREVQDGGFTWTFREVVTPTPRRLDRHHLAAIVFCAVSAAFMIAALGWFALNVVVPWVEGTT